MSAVNLKSQAVPEPEQAGPKDISSFTWTLLSGIIMLTGAFLRLYDLALKPLHHDEGVNGFFLQRLVKEGVYHYDPANYHGPTLYYFALVSTSLNSFFRGNSGLSTVAVRLVPALFGIATIWLVLCLRRHIGSIGALTAAALLALSPGAVYMSRYFIHESLFVFFTLGIVVASLRYYESANPVYLMLASASAALLFATKETAMISAGVLLIALAATAMYVPLRMAVANERRPQTGKRSRNAPPDTLSETRQRFDNPVLIIGWALAAIILFVIVYLLFYSSFLTYAKGVSDSLKTFKIWARTGKNDHVHEWYTYLMWLWQEEGAVLGLGTAGVVVALWRARNRFAVFAALWAIGIIAAYSLIPYKTPWLALNFIVPLAIIGGYGIEALYRWGADDLQQRALVLALALAALFTSGYQMIRLNFQHYDDEQYVYPYAHTVRELLPLVDNLNRFAVSAGTGAQTPINITSPEYWPLPWYLRDYTRVGYAGRVAISNEPLIIGSEAQELELESALGDRYRRIGTYPLRPNVTLVLYARRDLAEH
ncbi:MAG TPA: flippase activity-associated protein Agl23 [Pyrinomonadaceae bacterium]